MKLLELYALATGLRIGQQYLFESFYPLPFERYVTLQAGSGMAAKNYPHYDEVLKLILPALTAAGVQVVQLGGKEDPALPGCYHTQGQTTLHQSNYLLRRALCHIGNDSWLSHRGGEMGVPLIIGFGPTSVANHSPYRFNAAKSTFIESHRFGRRPSFQSQEHPSTIALIPPEQIANAVLSTLGPSMAQMRNVITSDISQYETLKVTRQSLYFGDSYHTPAIELVPNAVVNPQIAIPGHLILRMDYVDAKDTAAVTASENALIGNLQLRKCLIITDRELNLNHLTQLKPNIAGLRIEVDRVSTEWIKAVKRLGVQTAFFSSERDPEKLAARRLELYDACLFDHYTPTTREDFVKGAGVYLNRPLDYATVAERLRFSTQKFLLSENKVYLSEAHWRAGQSTPGTDQNTGAIIDSPAFWSDIAHFALFLP